MKYLAWFQEGTYKESIVKCAVGSRITLLLLQLLSNLVIPDHNANVFMHPKDNYTLTLFDNATHLVFDGFVRWDAQYFIHIALHGYTFENTIAFFPLFPLTIRYISLPLSYLTSVLNFESLLLIVSFNLNLLLFTKTALVLYELTLMFRSPHFAYVTSLLFCFNPASIFFSAPYSECLFCYLTFQSIHHCIKLSISWLQSTCKSLSLSYNLYCVIYISLSLLTRSNGILNIVFFIYIYLWVTVNKFSFKDFKLFDGIVSIVNLLFYILLMILPFIIMQCYDYYIFCTNFNHTLPNFLLDHAESNQLLLWGSFTKYNQSWCYKSFPIAYSHVQEHYWNVGFLKYYELKQLPNFCLAVPVIYIVLNSSINYLFNHKYMLIHMGILRKLFNYYDLNTIEKTKKENQLKLFMFDIEFACIIHILLLTIFCMFCIHIQVTTRMVFSASPVVYWFCCQIYLVNKKGNTFIKYYYSFYFIFGTIMFCNFLPWT